MANLEGSRGSIAALMRLTKFLPKRDLTLIVLKGHLLAEEQLISLIHANLKHPQAISRLTFSKRLGLANAMYYKTQNAWIWTSLGKLNEARNRLAHNLYEEMLETKAS